MGPDGTGWPAAGWLIGAPHAGLEPFEIVVVYIGVVVQVGVCAARGVGLFDPRRTSLEGSEILPIHVAVLVEITRGSGGGDQAASGERR